MFCSVTSSFTISIFHAMKKMSQGSKMISTFMLRINRGQGLTGKESHPIQLCVNRCTLSWLSKHTMIAVSDAFFATYVL